MAGEEKFIRLRIRPRLLAVDECEKDKAPKTCANEVMLRRIPPKESKVPRAVPVGLHWRFDMCEQCGCGEGGSEKTFEEKVKEALETVRSALQSHGGDVELVGTEDDNTVRIRLQGACHGCPGAMMTLKMGFERILKEKVPEVKKVVAVN